MISAYFPNPEKEYRLDADDPADQDTLEKLRVHIDAIKPVWRTDLKAEWFDMLDTTYKKLMHPYDVANPPEGEGWVIQLVCHHYNPTPSMSQLKFPVTDPRRVEFGPYQYITEKVLKTFSDPRLRLFGVKNVALAWLVPEKNWTTEKGNLSSNTVPLLARASAPAGEGGGGGGRNAGRHGWWRQGQGDDGWHGPDAWWQMGRGGQGGMYAGGREERAWASHGTDDGHARHDGRHRPLRRPRESEAQVPDPYRLLDPVRLAAAQPEQQPQTDEDRAAKLKELVDKMVEAEKNNPAVTMPKLEEIEAASLKASQQIDSRCRRP